MKLENGFYRDLPFWQQKVDYGTRTDGQPVYVGNAHLGTADDDEKWILTFFKYDESNQMVEKYSLEGTWDDRAALFLDYA